MSRQRGRRRGKEDESVLDAANARRHARARHSRAAYEAQHERWAQEVACDNLGTGG